VPLDDYPRVLDGDRSLVQVEHVSPNPSKLGAAHAGGSGEDPHPGETVIERDPEPCGQLVERPRLRPVAPAAGLPGEACASRSPTLPSTRDSWVTISSLWAFRTFSRHISSTKEGRAGWLLAERGCAGTTIASLASPTDD
jgi:hypothetical protein